MVVVVTQCVNYLNEQLVSNYRVRVNVSVSAARSLLLMLSTCVVLLQVSGLVDLDGPGLGPQGTQRGQLPFYLVTF